MGGSTSKINQLATVINKQTLNVSTSSEFSAHTDIGNSARIVATHGAKVDGVYIRQFAKANLSVLKSEANNLNFTSALKNKIKAAVDTKKSDFGISNEDMTNVNTSIDNSIELHYSTEKLTTLDSKIKNEAVMIARDEGSSIRNATIDQQADAFMKFVDNASMDLATSILADTDAESSIKKVSTNPISDVIDSAGTAIGGLLGLDTSTVVMLIIMAIVAAIVAGVGGYFYYKQQQKKGGAPSAIRGKPSYEIMNIPPPATNDISMNLPAIGTY